MKHLKLTFVGLLALTAASDAFAQGPPGLRRWAVACRVSRAAAHRVSRWPVACRVSRAVVVCRGGPRWATGATTPRLFHAPSNEIRTASLGCFFDQLTELVKIPEDALQELDYGIDR